MRMAAFLLMMGCGLASAQPQGFSAQEIKTHCMTQVRVIEAGRGTLEDGVSSSFCVGYLSGIVDSLIIRGFICPSSYPSNEQAARIFVNHVNKHPEQMNMSAFYVSSMSYADAFPCAPRSH